MAFGPKAVNRGWYTAPAPSAEHHGQELRNARQKSRHDIPGLDLTLTQKVRKPGGLLLQLGIGQRLPVKVAANPLKGHPAVCGPAIATLRASVEPAGEPALEELTFQSIDPEIAVGAIIIPHR